MTKNTTTPRRRRKSVPSAILIPLTVLAQLPEKLRLLGKTLKTAADAIDQAQEFSKAHDKCRTAFKDANDTANCVINTLDQLSQSFGANPTRTREIAFRAASITTAIYKVCGNVHNDDCFKTTFNDPATVRAIVKALNECGDEIHAVLEPLGL